MFSVIILLLVLFVIYTNLIKSAENSRNYVLRDALLAPARYLYMTGFAGSLVIAGAIIHSWDMYLKLSNPAAYGNFALFKWIPVVSGVCILLGLVVSIFKSLFTTSSISLFIVLGIPILERLNVCIVGMAGGIKKLLLELMLVLVAIMIFIGPAICLDMAALAWFFGFSGVLITTIGGALLLLLVSSIGAGAIEGIFTSGAMYRDYAMTSINVPVLILCLVFFILSLMFEKTKIAKSNS